MNLFLLLFAAGPVIQRKDRIIWIDLEVSNNIILMIMLL